MTHATIPCPDFFTSDLHIGHDNILKYDRRPFRDVDEMLFELVANYRSMVSPDHHAMFLGDVFFRATKSEAAYIMSFLPGRKSLILGNHDRHSKSWYRDVGFETVLDSATIHNEELGDVTLIHNPLLAVGERKSNYVIHGHKHSTEPLSTVCGVTRVDCGVTAWNYYPAPATKVIDLLRVI